MLRAKLSITKICLFLFTIAFSSACIATTPTPLPTNATGGANYYSQLPAASTAVGLPQVQTIIMHLVLGGPYDGSSYTPTCFPTTSMYYETLLDTKVMGTLAPGNGGGVFLYRCLRTSFPYGNSSDTNTCSITTNIPVCNGWVLNPNNSGEVISTQYTTYDLAYANSYWAELGSTGTTTPPSMSSSWTVFGSLCFTYYNGTSSSNDYQQFGAELVYNGLSNTNNGNTSLGAPNVLTYQTWPYGQWNSSGGNCANKAVGVEVSALPGWIQVKTAPYVTSGAQCIVCDANVPIYVFMPPSSVGGACYIEMFAWWSTSSPTIYTGGAGSCASGMNASGNAAGYEFIGQSNRSDFSSIMLCTATLNCSSSRSAGPPTPPD